MHQKVSLSSAYIPVHKLDIFCLSETYLQNFIWWRQFGNTWLQYY